MKGCIDCGVVSSRREAVQASKRVTHLAPNVVVVVPVPLAKATARVPLVVFARLYVPLVAGKDIVAISVGVPGDQVTGLQTLQHEKTQRRTITPMGARDGPRRSQAKTKRGERQLCMARLLLHAPRTAGSNSKAQGRPETPAPAATACRCTARASGSLGHFALPPGHAPSAEQATERQNCARHFPSRSTDLSLFLSAAHRKLQDGEHALGRSEWSPGNRGRKRNWRSCLTAGSDSANPKIKKGEKRKK